MRFRGTKRSWPIYAFPKGPATFHEGPANKPNLTIKTPADVWLKISRGELNGQQAFMNGRYKVEGDMNLLLRMKHLFSR